MSNRTVEYMEKAKEAYFNGEMSQNNVVFAQNFQMNPKVESDFIRLVNFALEFDLMNNEEANSMREMVLGFTLRPAYEQVAVLAIMNNLMKAQEEGEKR